MRLDTAAATAVSISGRAAMSTEASPRPKPLIQVLCEQSLYAFDRRAISDFKRFLSHNRNVVEWLVASDYNIGDKERPCDAIAFTIFPVRNETTILTDLRRCFIADFKNIKRVGDAAKGFFRRKSASFSVCWLLEKDASLLHRPDETKLAVARRSVAETHKYIEEVAPPWMVAKSKSLVQLSLSNKFPSKVFDKIMVVSACYSVLVGLLHREQPSTQKVMWCSDRDAMTTWGNGALVDYAMMNAARWTTRFGKSLQSEDLPMIMMGTARNDPFDPAIRPADYLAAALSSCQLDGSGSVQKGMKYRDVLRDIVANNRNVVLLQTRIGQYLSVKELRLLRQTKSEEVAAPDKALKDTPP